jgi:hypothetical protein
MTSAKGNDPFVLGMRNTAGHGAEAGKRSEYIISPTVYKKGVGYCVLTEYLTLRIKKKKPQKKPKYNKPVNH